MELLTYFDITRLAFSPTTTTDYKDKIDYYMKKHGPKQIKSTFLDTNIDLKRFIDKQT